MSLTANCTKGSGELDGDGEGVGERVGVGEDEDVGAAVVVLVDVCVGETGDCVDVAVLEDVADEVEVLVLVDVRVDVAEEVDVLVLVEVAVAVAEDDAVPVLVEVAVPVLVDEDVGETACSAIRRTSWLDVSDWNMGVRDKGVENKSHQLIPTPAIAHSQPVRRCRKHPQPRLEAGRMRTPSRSHPHCRWQSCPRG